MNKEVVLLGIGNEILTDDGIGPKIVKYFEEIKLDEIADYKTAYLGGLEILDYIEGYKTAIFIDATMTKDGIPGTIYEYTPDNYVETLHLSNFHDASFLNTLKYGKIIGIEMPENIYIYAIEIIEDRVFDISFSPEIQRKYSEICNSIQNSIELIIES